MSGQAVPGDVDGAMPLPGFNFHVAIEVKALGGAGLCHGSFSDVTGLEASMEPKVIRAGGRNYGAFQRAGSVSFSTVVLKRGMTAGRDLWRWWSLFAGAPDTGAGDRSPAARATVYISHLDGERQPLVVWKLENAMPVRFKAGDLSSKSGEIAIEELHLAHEGLAVEPPRGAR